MRKLFTNTVFGLTLREAIFRVVCTHKPGDKPNILLFCTRRSGSTWVLNTLSAHPGMRYVGKPFLQALRSRHKRIVPSLNKAANDDTGYKFEQFVSIPNGDLPAFDAFARKLLLAEIEVYPTLNMKSDYFHRLTDRVVYQVTNAIAMAEHLAEALPVQTALLMRHPISNALSIMRAGWRAECNDFLLNESFRDGVLSGEQVDLTNNVIANGDELAKHVLDWCLKVMLPLRAIDTGQADGWLVMTYEQTVQAPELAVRRMAQAFGLSDLDAMLAQVRRPSRTVTNTTADKVADKDYLIGRWQKRVDTSTRAELFKIVRAFGIDAYREDALTASDQYLPKA